jgi:hypothetical protein
MRVRIYDVRGCNWLILKLCLLRCTTTAGIEPDGAGIKVPSFIYPPLMRNQI